MALEGSLDRGADHQLCCLSLHSPPFFEPCLRATRVSAQYLHTDTSQDLVCSSVKDSILTCMNLVDRVTHTPQEVQVTCRTLGNMDHTCDLGRYRVTLAMVTSLLPFTLTQERILRECRRERQFSGRHQVSHRCLTSRLSCLPEGLSVLATL